MKLERASGILLHPTSLPNGVLDEHAYRSSTGSPPPASAGGRCCRSGRRTADRLAVHVAVGLRGLAGAARRAAARVTRAEAAAFRERNAYWIDDWVDCRTAAARSTTRCDSSASGRRCALMRRERGVRIFGDMPIYVAANGADHLAHPELFQQGVVAGVPPDAFAATGQLWGNPLYDWSAMRAEGYRWWIERFRRTFALVDLTRVDHFRGFVSYWAVPAGNATAVEGGWRRGPGASLFRAVERELGELPVVAEDLGVITEPVVRLRRELGFPGMVVLQFAAPGDHTNPHLPENHEEHSVVYTGTHDNDTTRGWWESLSHEERRWSALDPPSRPGR